MTLIPISGMPLNYRPVTNIVPFSEQDGSRYLEVLYDLKRFLNDTVITHINTEVGELAESWKATTEKLIGDVEEQLATQTADVDGKITSLEDYVDEAVNSIIGSTIVVVDPVMKAVIANLTSQTRVYLDTLYAGKSVQTLTETGRLSASALDAAYASKATQTAVESGRLTKPALDGDYSAKSTQATVESGRLSAAKLEAKYTPKLPGGSAKSTTGSTYSGIPGAQLSATQPRTVTSVSRFYNAFCTASDINVTTVRLEVTTAAVTTGVIQVGIYAADNEWQPVDLIASVSIDVVAGFIGVKTATLSTELLAGNYLTAIHSNQSFNLRGFNGGVGFIQPAMGVTPAAANLTAGTAYTVLPPTGVKWNGLSAGVAQEHIATFIWAEKSVAPRARNFMLPNSEVIKGANLTVKGGTNWDHFWGSAWDWEGWVKWQIDKAKSVGANTIRVCGDFQAVWTGVITPTVFRNRWLQIIEYSASLGMYTYVNGGGASVGSVGTMTTADIIAALVDLGKLINGDSRVIGYDLIAESYVWSSTNGAAASAAVRAVCDRKITYSIPASTNVLTNHFNGTFAQETLRPHVDYYDYHVYYDAGPSDIDYFFAANSKPVVFGEYGGTVSLGVPGVTERYASIRRLMERVTADGKHVAGGCVWAVTDHSTVPTLQFGLWLPDGTPRQYYIDAFKLFPSKR